MMIQTILLVGLAAYASAVATEISGAWKFTGSYTAASGTAVLSVLPYGTAAAFTPTSWTAYGSGSPSYSTNYQWTTSRVLMDASMMYAYGYAKVTEQTSTGTNVGSYHYCVSGAFTPSPAISWSVTGNLGWSTFSISGTGTGKAAGSGYDGKYMGSATNFMISPAASTPGMMPVLCGPMTMSGNAKTFSSSGLSAAGSFSAGGTFKFGGAYTGTALIVGTVTSGVRYITGAGSIKMGTTAVALGFSDVTFSGPMFTAYGQAGGYPFSAIGQYAYGGNANGFWMTNSVIVSGLSGSASGGIPTVNVYGKGPSGAAFYKAMKSTTVQSMTGVLTDHNSLDTTCKGVPLTISAYGGRWEAKLTGVKQYSSGEAIRGTFSVPMSTSGSSSGGMSSYTFSASGNYHDLQYTISGNFGPAGSWYTTSAIFMCMSTFSAVGSGCTSLGSTCATPSFAKGGNLRACGSVDRTLGTYSGSGMFQNYPVTVAGNIAVGTTGKLYGMATVANIEIPVSGTLTTGNIFTLSGTGQGAGTGTTSFSANGIMIGNAWSFTSGYFSSK